MGGSGVQRPLKFAKYLRDFGWNPIILCPEPGIYHTFDASLQVELDAIELEIHRVHGGDIFQKASAGKSIKEVKPDEKTSKRLRRISRLFFYPDNKRGWIKPALNKAKEIISHQKIDLIFSTAPPFSNHILGKKLKEETGIPLIVDYRDSWTKNHFQDEMWAWQKQILRNQERQVVASADKVICLDEFIKNEFSEDYPEITDRIEVLSHGFDPKDFEEIGVQHSFNYQEGKINFLYSGLFYEQNQPDSFLLAFKKLFEIEPELKSKIHLHFQGGLDERIGSLLQLYGMTDIVEDYGYLPHTSAVQNLLKADVLWMLSNFNPRLKQIKSGKLFEYIGTKKPILGLVHESEASKVLEEYGAGYWAPPNDEELIIEQLRKIITDWRSNSLPVPNDEFLTRFDRIELTKKLAQIFNVISS